MSDGSRFVDVPSASLFAFLASKGFEKTTHRREVVFSRKHHRDPRFSVLVYTSVRAGSSRARRCGADAIRVCAIFVPTELREPSRGVARLPKVLRTAPPGKPEERVAHVLERVYGRMREAYAVVNRQVAARSSTRVDAEVLR